MHNLELLSSVLYLLVCATLLVVLSKNLKLGSILGLLIAGIIVGPYSPGPILTEHVDTVRHITEFGVVLLLFVIGLEMQPKKLWSMRKEVFGLGSGQIILSGLLIAAYAFIYSDTWKAAIVMGFTFALSSTAFVMQILQEKSALNTKSGKSSFSILLMQDLAIVPLLAMIPLFSTKASTSLNVPLWQQIITVVIAITLVILFGRYVVPLGLNYIAKKQNREAFFFMVVLSVVFASWAMEFAGLSMALGAFLMGMLLSSSKYHYQIQAHIEPYKGILMTLFFVAVGMSIDLDALMDDPGLLLQHLLVIMSIKIVALFFLMLLMGYYKSIAIKVSFLLAQSGEFGFVLLGSAKALDVISDELFIMGITIISFSMLLTPMIVSLGDKLASKLSSEEASIAQNSEMTVSTNDEVVIVGYGRVGRLVATMLEHANITYKAFDVHKVRIELGRKEGRAVYYGDLSNYSFLSTMGLDKAKSVIITVDNHHSTAKIVSHIRNLYPELRILSRTKDLKSKAILLKHGASWVMPETLEGSLKLGAEVLLDIGKPQEDVQDLIMQFRKDDYELIKVLHEEN